MVSKAPLTLKIRKKRTLDSEGIKAKLAKEVLAPPKTPAAFAPKRVTRPRKRPVATPSPAVVKAPTVPATSLPVAVSEVPDAAPIEAPGVEQPGINKKRLTHMARQCKKFLTAYQAAYPGEEL